MEIVNYDEPPSVRYSTSSETGSLDSRRSGSNTTNTTRSVHFDQVNPTFVSSDSSNINSGKGGVSVVTAKDGEPVHVKEHMIKTKRKRKLIKAPISAYAMGPWPVVNQPEDGPRTVHEKHLKVYIIASIIACILFFPTGIPSLIFALKTKREFYGGIERRGEVTEAAIKASRKCEKLLILTGICLLLLAVVIFAVVEKVVHGGPTTHRITG